MPLKLLSLFTLVLLLAGTAAAKEREPTPQQRDFLVAKEAIKKGQLSNYRRLASGLADYPLAPYLEYEYLRKYLTRTEPERVREFLTSQSDLPVTRLLRRSWLEHLAHSGRWDAFLKDYEETPNTELRCHNVTARLKNGRDDTVWEEVERLWLVGVSQPAACDPGFEAWRKAGRMSREHVVQRIGLAMDRGQLGLVSYLSRFLEEEDRSWVNRWTRIHSNPGRELARLDPEHGDKAWTARLFGHGVRRLARQDAAAADSLWREHRARYALDQDAIDETERAIGMRLAYARDPLATERLGQLAVRLDDREVREWRIRSALWHRDWASVLAGVEAMPPAERDAPDWTYWRARALEAMGRGEEAQPFFATAADCRCFYGFLAAERVGKPPAIDSVPLQVEAELLERLAQEPAAVRAREFHALGLMPDARREWRDFIESMDSDRLRAAAKLADSWGWHDQAILTLGRTDSLSDLELRFPTPFQEEVFAAVDKRELDTAFVYAVMRQESAFNVEARSPVGALGLMQLMPATARLTARQFKYPAPKTYELLSASNNINLGTAHLRYLLNKYEGNRLYTMAAYNAGPHRVKRWLPKDDAMPADIWIACVPFNETRNYVKRILAYTMIYEWRLGREPTPVSAHLPLIEPYPSVAQNISMNEQSQ